jgi:hypothetical protein
MTLFRLRTGAAGGRELVAVMVWHFSELGDHADDVCSSE